MDETTILFARLASAYLIVSGSGFLLSTKYYEKMVRGSATTDPVALNLSGAVHFLVGAFILIRHFRWASLPEVIVTLIGIAATVSTVVGRGVEKSGGQIMQHCQACDNGNEREPTASRKPSTDRLTLASDSPRAHQPQRQRTAGANAPYGDWHEHRHPHARGLAESNLPRYPVGKA